MGAPSVAVLLVDDEPDILESLALVLARDLPGLRVLTAHSGAAALDILRREPVALVVTDYRMPAMDGLALTAGIHRLHPGLPVILMTAYPDPALAARAVRDYQVGLIVAKPFDLDFLVATIRSFMTKPAKGPA